MTIYDTYKPFCSLQIYEHIVREALDVTYTLEGTAAVEDGSLFCHVNGVMEEGSDAWPVMATNDVDLAALIVLLRPEPIF